MRKDAESLYCPQPSTIIKEGVYSSRDYFPSHALRRTAELFSGGLNRSYVYGSDDGEILVLRVPREGQERQRTLAVLAEEYREIGALGRGIGVHVRTLPEQAAFIDRLGQLGIPTIGYLHVTSDSLLLYFIEGVPLHKKLKGANGDEELDLVDKTLENLLLAHKKGVVFGDRWVTNTMVLPNREVMEWDYDIELIADPKTSTTFELSQMLYHLVHFAKGNRVGVVERISQFFNARPVVLEHYDFSMLIDFLIAQKGYFRQKWEMQGKYYEDLEPPSAEIDLLARSLTRNVFQRKIAVAA